MKARFVLALMFVPLLASSTYSQSSDDRVRDQLRQVTLQLRQLQDDQATLQAQKAAAEAQRDAMRKQFAAAEVELQRAHREGERADAAQEELAKAKDALMQAGDAARQNLTERDKLQTTVTNARTLLAACEAKNAQLLTVGHEILAAYEKFDFGDAMGANEPFTRLQRVELENLAQRYEDHIDDGRYDPRAVRTPALPQAGDKRTGTGQ